MTGLSDVLLALGDELRAANHQVGEFDGGADEEGNPLKVPILFLGGATVELSVAIEANASGGVSVWVLKAEGSATFQRTAKITVQLNTEGSLPVGM